MKQNTNKKGLHKTPLPLKTKFSSKLKLKKPCVKFLKFNSIVLTFTPT